MHSVVRPLPKLTVFILAITLCGAMPAALLFGQERTPSDRPHILLPPSYGATPLSTILQGQAALTAARGDFLESAANSRLTNSVAAKREMENSVEWVRTYFQRKEINRQHTRPKSFIERQREINALTRRLIEKDYQVELSSDPTKALNSMLVELQVKAPPDRFYAGVTDSLVDSQFDQRLSPSDVRHIRIDNGGGTSAPLEFRADGVALETKWPLVLRIKELDAPRRAVEEARDTAIVELGSEGQLTPEASQDLRRKLDALAAAFNAYYTRTRRHQSTDAYFEYLAGERFLQSFAVGVHRMFIEEDPRPFDGSLAFRGDSVADLVGHMNRHGLQFAPWQPGDEGTYRRLFATIRHFYLQFVDKDDESG